MSSAVLTVESPYYRRLGAFFNERLPAWQILVLVPPFLVGLFSGKRFSGRDITFTWVDALAFVAFAGFYVILRVMDEHKDIDHDNEHYPERVLQRGLVTLKQLQYIGIGFAVYATCFSLAVDRGVGRVTIAWLIVLGFSLLLLRYFFVRSILEPHRLFVLLTHVPATPLAVLWIAQYGSRGHTLPAEAGVLFAMVLVGTCAVEIGRKSRTPEDDRTTVVDYMKPLGSWDSLGLRGSVAALVILPAANSALGATYLGVLSLGSVWAYVLVALTFVAPAALAIRFAFSPSRFTCAPVASACMAATFLVQVVIAAALIVGN